jgi:hypothetical protein
MHHLLLRIAAETGQPSQRPFDRAFLVSALCTGTTCARVQLLRTSPGGITPCSMQQSCDLPAPCSSCRPGPDVMMQAQAAYSLSTATLMLHVQHVMRTLWVEAAHTEQAAHSAPAPTHSWCLLQAEQYDVLDGPNGSQL